jgi:L-lactate dehydrogenase complex protein LldE
MTKPRVALFATCLVDLLRPQVGFAAAKLLRESGCDVEVPVQTCCGQPAYNGGDAKDAAALARNVIEAFEPFDYTVAPSGSCAGMIKVHYPRLLAEDAKWHGRAVSLAAKTHELFSFLVNIRGLKSVDAAFRAAASYHDSCSSLREMNVSAEPRKLLAHVRDLRLCEVTDRQTCCGFGGFFSIKYPEISAKMGGYKLADAKKSGADTVLGGDLGCLLHLAGIAARRGEAMKFRHAAEILAGMGAEPAIGEENP